MMRIVCVAAAVATLFGATPARSAEPVAAEASAPPARVAILETASRWRLFLVRGTECVRKADGSVAHVHEFRSLRNWRVKGRYQYSFREVEAGTFSPAPPPGDWAKADFDDNDWPRAEARVGLDPYAYRSIRLLYLRGRFEVTDPSAVGGLRFELAYEGGAAAYLNGVEIARGHLPAGPITHETLADDYLLEAYVAPNGDLLRNRRDREAHKERFVLRRRRLSVAIRAGQLRKGVNVLAVELRRAAPPPIYYEGKAEGVHIWARCWWSRIGVESASLTSADAEGVQPNASRPRGLRAWNHPVTRHVMADDWEDATRPLGPVELVGVRNGEFSGQVVLGSDSPIVGPKATVSELRSADGVIPASAIMVRYGMPWAYDAIRHPTLHIFDGLVESPPGEVPVAEGSGSAVVPVWVTVRVPPDAAPGRYAGTLTIRVAGAEPITTPVRLKVIGWTVPGPRDFAGHIGLIQSPRSVAMKYGVAMWSDEHWRLMGESFRQLGRVGNKVLYITLVRQTHFGNEHSMVRWVKGADGKLTPDYSIAERYVALAVKHMGPVPVVGAYCWEPASSMGAFGHYKPSDRDVLITLLDPKTGKLTEGTGPKWGTPEVRAFFRTALDGLRKVLARHGVDKSMMLALAGDHQPTDMALADLADASDHTPWIVHSHVYWSDLRKEPVGYLACVWGVMPVWEPGAQPIYGRKGRFYGWKNPTLVASFPRAGSGVFGSGLFLQTQPMIHRRAIEGAFMATGRATMPEPGVRGVGRLGADFWPVLKDKRGHNRGTLCGIYPASAWGQLRLSFATAYMLQPGPDGPVATVRLEMLRESQQEAEARIVLGEAILDEAKRSRLGEDLEVRCRAMLDERVRDYLRGIDGSDWRWFESWNCRAQSERHYELAAEVSRKLAQ